MVTQKLFECSLLKKAIDNFKMHLKGYSHSFLIKLSSPLGLTDHQTKLYSHMQGNKLDIVFTTCLLSLLRFDYTSFSCNFFFIKTSSNFAKTAVLLKKKINPPG